MAFVFSNHVSEHIWEGQQVRRKHGSGSVCECNSKKPETDTGMRKFHLINNGSIHLCTKNQGHQTIVELSGWIGSLAETNMSGPTYLLTYFTHLRDYVRTADSDQTAYYAFGFSWFVPVAIDFFISKKHLFYTFLPFHSYVVRPISIFVAQDLCTYRIIGHVCQASSAKMLLCDLNTVTQSTSSLSMR